MNNKDDSEMKNPLINDESLLSEKFSRRSFMKGFAATTAAVSLSTILPANILADGEGTEQAEAADAYASGNGIYINGGNVNMNGKTYTLEFTQPVQLQAIIGGKVQTDGIWRSNYKHLVSVDPNGTVRMRDGVGGYDVVVSWTKDGITYKVNFHTAQTAGGYSIDVDAPQKRGEFMMQLAEYFGWCHYNNVMDDGSDIDDNGDYSEERVRNYYDVTGNAEYVKPIEAALDMFVLHADSPDECFYPLSNMTRQDAAVIIQRAFHIEDCEEDHIAGFEDADQIDPECYSALNALVCHNFMRGRTNLTLNPTEAITYTETRIILEAINGAVSAPVWCMPVSNRKFVRIRPYFQCPDKEATLHYRFRCVRCSDDRLLGYKIQDVTMANDGPWTDWIDFIPDYTIDPFFGLQSCHMLPYDTIWHVVELEVYSSKPGKADSGVSHYVWRVERPAWHDFAFDQLHEKTSNYPAVYRFFDNFQAAAYYIEGNNRGILYDGLSATKTNITLAEYVLGANPMNRVIATKPFDFVLGHAHGDHQGAMHPGYHKIPELKVYVCDRVGTNYGDRGSYTIDPVDFIDGKTPMAEESKTFNFTYDDPERLIHIDEGHVFDLGGTKLETYRLPGHHDTMLILYDRAHGLLFSSDIYGVNRYWVADQFSATGVKQDLVLSLHQQLMEEYTKGGAVVKELYTGHNRIGVGMDYLVVWEQALQNMVDWGDAAYKDDRRGNGAILARNGFSLDTMNWQGFVESGKQVVAEYESERTGSTFRRIEMDNTGRGPSTQGVNLYFDRNSVTALSNVSFRDAKLIGHDFRFKVGTNNEFATLGEKWGEDRKDELKFIIKNKFVPFEYEYEVMITEGQETVTFTPVAMSNRNQGVYVNGELVSSRCPVTVSTANPVVITVLGPDGTVPETPYKFTFINALQ